MTMDLRRWKLATLLLLRFDVRFVQLIRRISVLAPLPRRIGTGEPCPPAPTECPETLREAATVAADRPLLVGGSLESLEGLAIRAGHCPARDGHHVARKVVLQKQFCRRYPTSRKARG